MASYTLFPENLSLTTHELNMLYVLVRVELNRLQQDQKDLNPALSSYVYAIDVLDKKLTNSYLQRK